MKKRLCVLFLAALLIVSGVMLLCAPERGDTEDVKIDYGKSHIFTDREQQDAANALIKEFQKTFPDYSLQEVWYISDYWQLEYSRDVDCEERNIIYISNMERKETSSEEPEPEQLLRYRWCVAQNDAGHWYVFDHGF